MSRPQTTTRGVAARQAILDAAAAELAETGELEVAAVARRAQVSNGLPYRYFATRSGLLIAVVEDFYHRLGQAAALRTYAAPTWQRRERQRVTDWVAFLYSDPLVAVVLERLVGDADVAAANTRQLALLIELGARNIAAGQRDGDLPAGRDPELLAAAVLGGIHAAMSVILTRDPRPSADSVVDQLWTIVAGIVGLTAT